MRFLISTILTIGLAMTCTTDANDSWPQWRGADQNGVAQGDRFPHEWSDDDGVAWKTKLPGRGGSTPVVRQGTAYLTAGVDGKNVLIAIDTQSGKIAWQAELGQDKAHKHRKGSGSNPSAVIDGEHIYAYFRSGDVGCVSTSGDVVWHSNLQKEFGEDTLWWDLGSSPTLTDSAVVVAVMQTGPSYLIALDKKSGDQLWKADRMLGAPQEAAQSYATPIAVEVNGRKMIAVMGADHLTIHSADDGKELGRLGGFNPTNHQYFRSIASPVASGNIIICPYARGETVTAVRMDQLIAGKGKDAIAWSRETLGSDVPSPAIDKGRIYIIGDSDKANKKGRISCHDLETGKTIWEHQLPKARVTFTSSPLVAGNHLYVTSENATTYVVGPLDSNEPGLVSANQLADSELYTVASPVPVGDSILLRSRYHLYRLGNK